MKTTMDNFSQAHGNAAARTSNRRQDGSNLSGLGLSPWPFSVLFVAFSLLVIVSGIWFYRQESGAIKHKKYDELKAIADLKIDQIIAWRRERLIDARINAEGSFIRSVVRKWIAAPDDVSLKTGIMEHMKMIRRLEGYENVILTGIGGELLITLDHYLTRLDPTAQKLVSQAVSSNKAIFGDFFLCPEGDHVHLDVAVPFVDDQNRPVAVLIQRIDPHSVFYRIIRSWPMPSRSAETLVVRKEKDHVMFLNPLRHRSDPALTFRYPLSRTDLPAVRVAMGQTGMFEGRDYRGVDVLADIRPVPGSLWFMVTKVDADEILAEAEERAIFIGVIMLLLVAASGAGLGFVYKHKTKRSLQALYQAEEELRKSEEKYRLIAENMADVITIMDMNLRFTYVSPSIRQLRGFTVEEAMTQTIDRIMTPESLRFVSRVFEEEMQLEAAGTAHPDRSRILILEEYKKDGSTAWVENTLSFIRDKDQKPVGILAVARDITAHKQADEDVRIAKARLEDLYENAPDMFLSVDAATADILECNDTLIKVTGYVKEEIIGKPVFTLYHPDCLEQARQVFQFFLNTGEVHDAELQIKRKDGTRIFVNLNATAVRDENGKILHSRSIWRDITAIKKAEQVLHESELRYRTILEQAADAVFIHDETGRIIDVNQKACQSLGYTRTELISKYIEDIDPEAIQAGKDTLWSSILAGGQVTFESRQIRKNGSVFPVEVTLGSVNLPNNPVILGIVRDISERKKAEEERKSLQDQLLQAQKMESVGRLAGGVAHDFNNMLSVIIGHAEMAMEQMDTGNAVYVDLQEIRTAAQRSSDLTRQLLAFARRQTVSPVVLNLNDTVSSMLKMLRRLIGEDINLVWKPGQSVGKIKIDPIQIDQILANLLVNAKDAIPGVGEVFIETADAEFDEAFCRTHAGFFPGRFVMIAVRDSGKGMDQESLDHIFEPFYTTKEVGRGTGLGLATVYGIVRQNNGFIMVDSEPGRGTTFTIYFPKSFESVEDKQEDMKTMPCSGTETVLLVEDEAAILNLGKTILHRYGYSVLSAETPDKAISLSENHPGEIHLLVTDVIMPEMNGSDLKEILVRRHPRIKCLFISGYTADAISDHGVLDDGIHFLQKPFSVHELAEKVREALDGE